MLIIIASNRTKMAITSLTERRSMQIADGKESFNLRSGKHCSLEYIKVKGMYVGCACVMLNIKWPRCCVFLSQLLYLLMLQFNRVRITWESAAMVSRIQRL